MSIWCNTCKCHVNAPCVSHHESDDQRRSPGRRFRSTKGASKARRDHINREIRNLRALLPISSDDQERLSYLHSMAAICTYIRKSLFFQDLQSAERSHSSLPYEAFLQALHGFILVTTDQGKLVYVSENVSEYLGFSMVDVLQGDSVYDMVVQSDADIVAGSLRRHSLKDTSAERSFVCHMQTSRSFRLQQGDCCSMLVRGKFTSFARSSVSEPLFVAVCTPTVDRLTPSDSHWGHSFHSLHALDMTFTQLTGSVLGYPAEELTGQSWYGLVHPEDLTRAADAHRRLVQAGDGMQAELLLRLQSKDLTWIWVYTRANRDPTSISCTNFCISETETKFLQKKLSSAPHFPAPQADKWSGPDPGCEPMSCSSFTASPALLMSPVLFTPPYSPASSCSPLQQHEFHPQLLMDVQDYTDQLLSSPEASPSYFPQTTLTCHLPPSASLPAATHQTFHQEAFGPLTAPSPSPPPICDLQASTSDARLVPEFSSVMSERVEDRELHQDDFSIMEQPQGGSLHQLHQVPVMHPGLLTPFPSPTSVGPNRFDEREREEISILAEQISSLASSFDMYHALNPGQGVSKQELDIDVLMFDSILQDLVPCKDSSPDSSVAPCCWQQGARPDRGDFQLDHEALSFSPTFSYHSGAVSLDSLPLQHAGLYQLSHFMQHSLHPGENMDGYYMA
ncbi:neuronal PAS domain-containing protein 4-like [Neosynchiropus ocellatus]